MTQKPPYKTEQNVWRTASLFHDLVSTRAKTQRMDEEPVFSLHDDIPGLINARKAFVNTNDPTGYTWAMTYLGSWEHFQKLMKARWFREAFDLWVEELAAKRKSEAIAAIREIASDETNKSRLPAARFLAELDKKPHTRGRPSKEEISAELKQQMKELTVEDEDAARIGLRIVK